MAPVMEVEEVEPQEQLHHTFASPSSYFKGLLELPTRLKYRFMAIYTPEQELTAVKSRSGTAMKANLEWYDMVFFGIGAMVGAGIFVSTGEIANGIAGPAVLIAYIVSGISAMLSSLCYSEFAIQVPTAGGAFTYLRVTMGEFASYFTAGNLIMEYVLSASAVARGFTSYFCTVFGNQDTNAWRIYVPSFADGFQYLDPVAVGLILVLTALLCWGSKQTSWMNLGAVFIHLLLMAFIIVVSWVEGNTSNLTQPDGFFPFGIHGIFNGAASAYFSYIGFDAVATMAEECRDPSKAIPIGIIGSVAFTILLYALMSLAICLLQPYNLIDPNAPFSTVFYSLGWDWAVKLVGIGAAIGTITSTTMSLLGQARYLTMIGRTHLVPFWFAKINKWSRTPVNATVFLGICSAILALFTSLDILIGMVSIGTLFVFFMVAEALLIRRHYVKGKNSPWPVVIALLLFDATSVGFAAYYWAVPDQWWGLVLCGGAAIVESIAFYFLVPQVYFPSQWHVPLSPWLVFFSIFLNVLLLGSLDTLSYKNFGYFSAALVAIYLLYGVHATWDLEGRGLDVEFPPGKSVDDVEVALDPPEGAAVTTAVAAEGEKLVGEAGEKATEAAEAKA